MLAVKNLSYERGGRCLFHDLSFELEPGQAIYVVGANGSGKSTLLKLVGDLLPRTQGQIHWEGHDVDDLGGQYRQNYVWLGEKDHGMKPQLSVAENVAYFYRLIQIDFPDDFMASIQEMGLSSCWHKNYDTLSLGERRRVHLLPLLTAHRPFWILDEPAQGLDEQGVALLDDLIERQTRSGSMVLCATHRFNRQELPQTRYLHLNCA